MTQKHFKVYGRSTSKESKLEHIGRGVQDSPIPGRQEGLYQERGGH